MEVKFKYHPREDFAHLGLEEKTREFASEEAVETWIAVNGYGHRYLYVKSENKVFVDNTNKYSSINTSFIDKHGKDEYIKSFAPNPCKVIWNNVWGDGGGQFECVNHIDALFLKKYMKNQSHGSAINVWFDFSPTEKEKEIAQLIYSY